MAIAKRTPMFDRNPQHGWYDYGNFQIHPGNIWFVGSCVTGCSNAFGWGMNPDSPFATIDYAVGQCVAGQCDVIYVLPGHTETLTAAGGLDLDVAGIRIIGIGEGTYQPIIDLTTAAGVDVDIDADSVWIENLHFVANFADITAAIDVNATDFTMKNCRCTQAGANLNALIWVQDAAALASGGMTIIDCEFIDVDAANTHCINFAGTGNRHVIRGNSMIGDWGTMALGGAWVITNAVVAENYIYNIAAVADVGINFAAAVTGLLVHNYASTGNASAAQITAAAMVKCQNYGGIISDANGLLEPIAT